MHSENIENSFFLGVLKTIWINKKIFFYTNFIVLIITIIILLLIPNEYKSTALISIKDEGSASPIPAILKDVSMGMLGGGSSEDAMFYQRIGKSRIILDSLNSLFNLKEIYDIEYHEDYYEEVSERLIIIDNEDGTFSVSYFDSNPDLAKSVTESVTDLIAYFDIKLNTNHAKNYRIFIESQLVEARRSLKKYEDSLKIFSEETGFIDAENQILKTIEFLSEIEKKHIELELQRDLIKQSSSEKNSQVLQLNQEIKVIKSKIDDLYKKRLYSNIPVNSIPREALTYFRIMREIKIKEAILEFLIPQFESAKLDEQKLISNLVVVDKAFLPEKKSKPHRTRILILIMAISFTGTIMVLRFFELYYPNIKLIFRS